MIKPIVVDDERIALDALAKKLTCIDGVEAPELFETAAEACAFLEGAAADIAFLDISLRDSDGLELAERVRELCPGCAIVFVTGYADYAVDAFRIHADGYVLKPVSVEDLEREIAHARERRAPAERALVRVQTFGGSRCTHATCRCISSAARVRSCSPSLSIGAARERRTCR